MDWVLRMDRQCLCLRQYHQLSKMLQYRALHQSNSELLHSHNFLRLCHHQDDSDESGTTFPRQWPGNLQINLADYVAPDSRLLGVSASYRHLWDLQSRVGSVKNDSRKSNSSKLVSLSDLDLKKIAATSGTGGPMPSTFSSICWQANESGQLISGSVGTLFVSWHVIISGNIQSKTTPPLSHLLLKIHCDF